MPKPSMPGMSSPKLQRKETHHYTSQLPAAANALKKICIVGGVPLDSFLRGLALELTGLPLLELGGPLAWGGGASGDTGGRLDLGFGRLKVHVERVCRALALRTVVVVKSAFGNKTHGFYLTLSPQPLIWFA